MKSRMRSMKKESPMSRLTPDEFKRATEVAGLLLMYEIGWHPGAPRLWMSRLKDKLLEMYPGITEEDLDSVVYQAELYTNSVIREAVNMAREARLRSDEILLNLSKRRKKK